jgi:phosphomannomutase
MKLMETIFSGPVDGVRYVTTPMHGVGQKPMTKAFETTGPAATCIFTVPEQENPDPDFPTVPFPNPEEQGETCLSSANLAPDGS